VNDWEVSVTTATILYEQVRIQNHLGHPAVIYINEWLTNMISHEDISSGQKAILQQILSQVEPNVRNLFSAFASSIRNGSYTSAVQLIDHNPEVIRCRDLFLSPLSLCNGESKLAL